MLRTAGCWIGPEQATVWHLQIWKNCRSFNAEGSDIAVMCTDAAKWVRRLWNQMGLPKKEKAGPKAPSDAEAEAEPAAGNSSKSSRRAQKAAAAAAANGGPQPEELPEEAVREAALGIRKRKRRDRDGQGPADAADEDAAAEGGLPRRKVIIPCVASEYRLVMQLQRLPSGMPLGHRQRTNMIRTNTASRDSQLL